MLKRNSHEHMMAKLKASGWQIKPITLLWCDCERFGGHFVEKRCVPIACQETLDIRAEGRPEVVEFRRAG